MLLLPILALVAKVKIHVIFLFWYLISKKKIKLSEFIHKLGGRVWKRKVNMLRCHKRHKYTRPSINSSTRRPLMLLKVLPV